jgi:hypothetical protein
MLTCQVAPPFFGQHQALIIVSHSSSLAVNHDHSIVASLDQLRYFTIQSTWLWK